MDIEPGKFTKADYDGKHRSAKVLETKKQAATRRAIAKNSNKILDLEQLSNMSSMGLTNAEIGTLLGYTGDWISKQAQRDGRVAMALEDGRARLRQSLRRTQVEVALNGSVPMLIWLGKQYLDQADKREDKVTTEVNILVQNCMSELDQLGKDRILEARRVLRGDRPGERDGGRGQENLDEEFVTDIETVGDPVGKEGGGE